MSPFFSNFSLCLPFSFFLPPLLLLPATPTLSLSFLLSRFSCPKGRHSQLSRRSSSRGQTSLPRGHHCLHRHCHPLSLRLPRTITPTSSFRVPSWGSLNLTTLMESSKAPLRMHLWPSSPNLAKTPPHKAGHLSATLMLGQCLSI